MTFLEEVEGEVLIYCSSAIIVIGCSEIHFFALLLHSDNRRKNVLYQTTIQVYSEKFLAPVSDDILHLPFHRVDAIPVEVCR